MTQINTIENKISSVKKYLKILTRYKRFSREQIEQDVDIRGAVERYLYLAVQSAIDLGEAVLSYKRFRKPATMNETFYILNEEGIISSELQEILIKMTGFRNVIAHDYEKVDYDIVYDILQNKLKDIEEFVLAIKDYLRI